MQANPLTTLHHVACALQSMNRLKDQRDACIRAAREMGYSERRIARAAKLSVARVHQILDQANPLTD